MALGNEASTGPRIARLEVANSLGATNNGGRWRAEVATRPLPILLNGPPYGGGIIVQAELPNGSMSLCAVALVKQDWENDHLSTWRTALSAQPNGSSESWTSRLKICAITPKRAPLFRIREASLLVHHLDLLVDYLTGKPINRDMNPITLLAVHHELVQTCGI